MMALYTLHPRVRMMIEAVLLTALMSLAVVGLAAIALDRADPLSWSFIFGAIAASLGYASVAKVPFHITATDRRAERMTASAAEVSVDGE